MTQVIHSNKKSEIFPTAMSGYSKLQSHQTFFCRTYILVLLVAHFFLQAIAQENGESENKICGTVSTSVGTSLTLREDVTVTPEEFESVHLGKLKNAVFSPVPGCVIKVCGYTWTEEPFYNSNYVETRNFKDCKIIQHGNESDIPNIFNDLFNTSSISCGCTKQVEDCELNCLEKHKKEINWQENECAILYEENNCRNCWFNPIVITSHEKFRTDRSHFIRSIIIRDKCFVDEKHYENYNWGSTYFPPIRANLENVLKLEYANYSCKCPDRDLTSTAPSTTSSTTSLGTTTSSNLTQAEPGWCGFINPRMSSALYLYENEIVDRNELAKIQFDGKVKNAMFTSKLNCTLEICGYSSTAKDPYDKGTCERYMDDHVITASPDIYDRFYEVTSMGCACRSEDDSKYYCSFGTVDHCNSINENHIWNDGECAIMFQERNCQSCYFKPISLLIGTNFQSLNSFQIKTMVVRPGCTVNKQTKGNLWIDKELTLKLEGIVKKTDPAYHKDSENFTCTCSPVVVSSTPDAGTSSEETTTPEVVTESLPPETTRQQEDKKHVLSAMQYVIIIAGLGTVGTVIAVAVILVRRHKKSALSRSNTGITLSYLESEQDDKDTNSNDYFPVVTFPRNELESENSQKLHLVSAKDNLTLEAKNQCMSQTNESYVTSDQSDDTSDKMEDKPNETQLKAEIMDEVKKLMESFIVGSAYNDEVYFLNIPQAPLAAGDAGPANFKLMTEQFKQICNPSNVISREAFMIPKKQLENPLGVGQFGIVYKAAFRQEPDGLLEHVALKKIKWMGSQSFFREIKAFQNIGPGNEYIVKFIGACCHTDGLFLLTEFCEGGSLRDHVVEKMRPQVLQQSGPLPETTVNLGDDYYATNNVLDQKCLEEIQPVLSSSDLHQMLDWSEQIAHGMEFLSSIKTIHDDLALRNILLTKDFKVKICDFGLSRKCLNTEDCARSLMTGDFPFNSFAPEFISENANEPKQVSLYVDVWAYGCTLYELFTLGDSLYQDVKEQGLLKFVTVRKLLMEGYRHPKPPLAPDSVYHKMINCWDEVPKNRPSFTDLRRFFEMETADAIDYTKC